MRFGSSNSSPSSHLCASWWCAGDLCEQLTKTIHVLVSTSSLSLLVWCGVRCSATSASNESKTIIFPSNEAAFAFAVQREPNPIRIQLIIASKPCLCVLPLLSARTYIQSSITGIFYLTFSYTKFPHSNQTRPHKSRGVRNNVRRITLLCFG